MNSVGKYRPISEEKYVVRWEHFLCVRRSRLRTALVSACICFVSFSIISVLYSTVGYYFGSVTLIATILITLYSGEPFQSLVFTSILTLLADYYFIPPTGAVLNSPRALSHFLTMFAISGLLVTFVSAMRFACYQTTQSKLIATDAVNDRNMLMSIISHELKNPLTSILSSVEMLKIILEEEKQNSKFPTLIGNIETCSRRMNRLVTDLLDEIVLSTGRVTLNCSKVLVTKLITDTLASFELRPKLKSIELGYRISPNCSKEVVCDADRVVQALCNLVGNAVKFTEQGSVLIQVTASGNRIRFEVRDTGPGIPTDQIQNVFDRFWQAGKTAHLGTGLGLSIARGIVEAHGGTIGVASVVGEGTTFFFELPKVQNARNHEEEFQNRYNKAI